MRKKEHFLSLEMNNCFHFARNYLVTKLLRCYIYGLSFSILFRLGLIKII